MRKAKRSIKFIRGVEYDAGKLLLKYQNGKIPMEQEDKESYAKHDLITAADPASQNLIIKRILESFPNDAIIAEETIDDPELKEKIEINKNSQNKWIIDPVDGTINFSSGRGNFASERFGISTAYSHEGMILMGGIYLPRKKEFFSAIKEGGSRLYRKKLELEPTEKLEESLIAGCVQRMNPAVEKVSSKIDENCRVFYNYHCATYSMSLLFKGQIQGYVHPCPKIWDVAAAMLIVEEAGGKVTWESNGYFIATCGGEIHEKLCDIVRENYKT